MNEDSLPSVFKLVKSFAMHSTEKYRMGCVIVDHGKPVCGGFNKTKTHPMFNYTEYQATIHAEASAIISSGKKKIKNSIAFVYRERANGEPAMARPCKYCMKLLKSFGVKKVVYSTNTYPYFTTEYIQ